MRYTRHVTLIKPNDVFYSRDIHIIDVVNNIIASTKVEIDVKDIISRELHMVLIGSNIDFEMNHSFFMLKEESFEEILVKKRGPFISKSVYELIHKYNLTEFIYITKLSFFNRTNTENLDANLNLIITYDDIIDDKKLLESNGYFFRSQCWFHENKVFDTLLNLARPSNGDEHISVYVSIFSGDMTDITFLLENGVKYYDKKIVNSIFIQMCFINFSNYNLELSKSKYEKMTVKPPYGLIRLFNKNIFSSLK
ncbi:MAG: hypothetical protein ACRC92_27070 [Peptostreptococcaceae bacterium]